MLEAQELRRIAEIMRENTPPLSGGMLIHIYQLHATQHLFIDALEQLAREKESND